ncbi:MAG: hypothetical protein SGJ10_02525 [Bacteroidota bacterium]|nr:hypothetical protein [Bacteroidota bacterium]
MNFKTVIIILLVQMLYLKAAAQKILVNAPVRVDSLMEAQIAKNKETNSISGYRVQLMQTTDRKKANDSKTALLEKYPDMDVYITFQAPNYKVRVGNYTKRIDCVTIYKLLLNDFPQSFVVPDKIELPEL